MFCAGKCDQWLIEALRLPIGFLRTPVAGVAGQTEDEVVVPPVLRGLVAVGAAVAASKAGGVDQREAQGVVIRFVGAVFTVGENRRAVSPALVGEIEPLV